MKTLAAIILSSLILTLGTAPVFAKGGTRGSTRAGGYPIGTLGPGAAGMPGSRYVGGYPIGTLGSGQTPSAYPSGTSPLGLKGYRGYRGYRGYSGYSGYRGYGGYFYGYPMTGAGQVPQATFVNDGTYTPTYYDHSGDVQSPPPTQPAAVPQLSFRTLGHTPATPYDRDLYATEYGFNPPLQVMSSAGFDATARADVSAKLKEAAQLFAQYKADGKLGTLDIEDLQDKLSALQQRAANIARAKPEQQTDMEASLRQDIADFQSQIHSHDD